MTTIQDVDTRIWTQRSNTRATQINVAAVRGLAAESDSAGTLGYAGHREYRVVGATAEPKWVIKALALIIGAVAVVGTGAVVGAASLGTPPPAHPVTAPASMTINIPKPK